MSLVPKDYTAPVATNTQTPVVGTVPTPSVTRTQSGGTITNINGGMVYSNPLDNPSFKSNAPVNTTIDAAQLGNVSTATVPPPVNTTTAQSSLGTAASTASAGAIADAKEAERMKGSASAAPSERNAIASSIKDLIGMKQGRGDFELNIQKEQDLEGKTNALNDVNRRITLQTKAYDDELKAIRGIGLTDVQRQQKAGEITRRRNEDIANLSIEKSVALGDFNTANAIIDKKVAAKFESIDNDIKNYQNLYQMLGDDLSESEKVTIQTKLEEKKAARESNANAYAAASKLLAENGGNSNIQAKLDALANDPNTTSGQFYGALGSYGVNASDKAYKDAQTKNLVEQNNPNSIDNQYKREQINNAKLQGQKTLSEIDSNNGASGKYTPKQLTALSKLNQDVSKNSTYVKTTSMRNYGDNVITSLSLGSGVGDIAAINQFQKVIDEGAVTRDQDVKLITSAQSLADRLQTKVNNLKKGEQLSPELRKEMRTAVEAMYEKQVEALKKDPYISAKTKEATLFGLTNDDTILGDLGSFTRSNDESTSPQVKSPEDYRSKYGY